jgi:glycosyltransferase involved in cell wall biosynthesis
VGRLRILFLSEAIAPHIHKWEDSFRELGWETLTASCDYNERFKGHRLEARQSRGPLRYLGLVDQIKAVVEDFKPYLINAHFLPTYGLAAALANIHPLVLTLWGSDILVSGRRGLLARLRSKFVLKRADLVVGDSQSLLDAASELASLQRRLLTVFGVRKSWVESGRERELKPVDPVNILSTRRFEPIYDLPTLLRAARVLLDEDKSFRLRLVGSGSKESELRQLAGQLDLGQSVEFTGHLSEERLFSVYRNADIYISTAKSDSTSVSLLEAMSQKLYPIVTDIPGNREWLESDNHFFEPGDFRGLAEKIKLGLDLGIRRQAYEDYREQLEQRGIREEQMRAAHLTFLNLLDEFRP